MPLPPFWETKSLHDLTHEEWEALCDGCGLCCLHKLQDEDDDTAPIYLTRVVCQSYDLEKGCCKNYLNRLEHVSECIILTPEDVQHFGWLPQTCAYRLLWEKKPLPTWHPLLSGATSSVDPYGIKQYDPVLETPDIDLEDYMIEELP